MAGIGNGVAPHALGDDGLRTSTAGFVRLSRWPGRASPRGTSLRGTGAGRGGPIMTVLRNLTVVALATMLACCSAAESTGSSETTATYAPLAPTSTAPAVTTTSAVPTTSPPPTTSSVPVAPSVAAASSAVSVEDLVAYLGEFSKDWNENNLRWITALSDPTESYEDFLQIQEEVGAGQSALLADLDLWLGTLDPGLRPAFEPLVENYRNRYQHIVDELFPATLGTDNDAFQAALQEHEAHALPEYHEGAVRSLVDHPAVASALDAEGIDRDEMVDSLTRTLSG